MADLMESSWSLDGSSGKFSGDWIADFDAIMSNAFDQYVNDN